MAGLIADDADALEDGSRGSTPTGDNALLDFARAEADCFAAIARANDGRVLRDDTLGMSLADAGTPTPFGNTAHLTKPIGDGAAPELAAALHEFFAAATGGPFLLFSPWPVSDLSTYGFHRIGHPLLMLRPPTAPAITLNPDLRIVAVETAEQLADFERVLIEAYPVPDMQPWRRESLLRPSLIETAWRFFVGYEGERAVATAAAWVADTVAAIEIVSTRDECRGKGYGAAITAAATHAAPGITAMLVASDLGRPVYDRLGYIPLLRYTLHIGMRGRD